MKDAACVRREGGVRIEQVRDSVHDEYDLISERGALGWGQGLGERSKRRDRGTASFLEEPKHGLKQTHLDACKSPVRGKSTE